MAAPGDQTVEFGQLRDRVERWRRTRGKLGPMPAELWDAAVAAARKHGVSETAREVGLDYGGLAKRVRAASAIDTEVPATIGFVEWSGAEILEQTVQPLGPRVEIVDTAGCRLSIHLASGESLDIPGLVAAFRAARP